jgi:hypothetical protein
MAREYRGRAAAASAVRLAHWDPTRSHLYGGRSRQEKHQPKHERHDGRLVSPLTHC